MRAVSTALILLSLSVLGCSRPFYKDAPRTPGTAHSVGSVPNTKDKLGTREFAESASLSHWSAFVKQDVVLLRSLYKKSLGNASGTAKSLEFLSTEDVLQACSDARALGAKTLLFGYDEGRCYALVQIPLDPFLKAWRDAVLKAAGKSEKGSLQRRLDATIALYKKRRPYKIGVTLPLGRFSRRNPRVR